MSKNLRRERRAPALLLLFVLLFSLSNQWVRWLPVYLSSVTTSSCVDSCKSLPFSPICSTCSESDSLQVLALSSKELTPLGHNSKISCEACHSCRKAEHSDTRSLMDGICMNTEQFGELTGLGFSMTFAVFGLAGGYIVDKKADKVSTILGVSSFLCGLTTLLSAYASGFESFLFSRALLGAVQALSAPASVYLITAYYHDSDRVGANAAYTVGVYLGAGLSSLSTLLANIFGWREVLKCVGWITILAALSFELVVDMAIMRGNNIEQQLLRIERQVTEGPDRYTNEGERQELLYGSYQSGDSEVGGAPYGDTPLRTLAPFPEQPSMLPLYLVLIASGLRFMGGIAVFVYFPVLLGRKFPEGENIFSVFNAVMLLTCGSASSIAGGRYGQLAVQKKGLIGLVRLASYSCIACAPLLIMAVLWPGFWGSLVFLAIGYSIGESWMPLSLAVLQSLSPKSNQGLVMSIYLFTNWIASALAVDMLAWLDPGTKSLQGALALTIGVTVLGSGLCFSALERVFDSAEADAREEEAEKRAASSLLENIE